MAKSAFEVCCEALEGVTTLTGLESRGTIRIALKKAGLEPARARHDEIRRALPHVLPPELGLRGIETPDDVCRKIDALLERAKLEESDSPGDATEEVFDRMDR